MTSEKEREKNVVFQNFAEYWHLTKKLSDRQRNIIFAALPKDQKNSIQKSYNTGGWSDLMTHDEVNSTLDELKSGYGIDVIGIRTKVYLGYSVYLSKKKWDVILEAFRNYKEQKHIHFAIGGIKAENVDEKTVLIIRD